MKITVPKFLLAAFFASATLQLLAQGTDFTYQGRLNLNGAPVTGNYDFRFRAASDAGGANFLGAPVLTNGVPVAGGLFVAAVDFGLGLFNGSNYWLQIEVKTNGAANYAALAPLQPFTPTPYAVFAGAAGSVTGIVPAAQLGGTLANSALPASPQFAGAVAASSFVGDGSGVTGVNAALLNGQASSNFWNTAGNPGTSPYSGNFIGTTDNQALEVRVNNTRILRLEPDPLGYGSGNLIAGYSGNSIDQADADGIFVAGGVEGLPNQVFSNSSGVFIGSGVGNQAGPNAWYTVIGGGYINSAASVGAVIGGGVENKVFAYSSEATIGGGELNSIQGNYFFWSLGAVPAQTIAGGAYNTIQTNTDSSTIGGGLSNTIQTNSSGGTIAGGGNNTLFLGSAGGAIGGGSLNSAGGNDSTVPGGYRNNALGDHTFAAGTYASATHGGAFVLSDSQPASFNSTASNQFSARFGGGVRWVTGGAGMTLDGQAVLYSGGPGDGGGLSNLRNLNASQLTSGTVPLAALSGLTSAQIDAATWFLATNLNGGWAALASNLVAGLAITNAFVTNSVFAGDGGSLTNLNASQLKSGTVPTSVLAGFQAPSYAVVGGGYNNNAGGLYAAIPGGYNNTAAGQYSLAAGQNAQALHQGAFVWADSQTGLYSSPTNDTFNVRAQGGVNFSTRNAPFTVNGVNVLTGSAGNFWQTAGNAGTSPTNGNFLGTADNQPLELRVNNSRVWRANQASSPLNGTALNLLGGSAANFVSTNVAGASIGGGGTTNGWVKYGSGLITGQGPGSNVVSADYGTVPGGMGNVAGGVGATAMGVFTVATGDFSTAMGFRSQAGGAEAVALGSSCAASGTASLAGGADCTASGYASVALGYSAQAAHPGAFVWADGDQPGTFASSAANQFLIHADGGVGIGITNPAYALDVGGRIRLRQESGGNTAGLWLYQNGPAADRAFIGMDGDGYAGLWGNLGAGWGMIMNVTNGYVGIGNANPTNRLMVANARCDGSSWINASDRNLKQGFAGVDAQAVLAKVAALPVQTWSYKAQPAEKHLGPVAQDFRAAFGLGSDDVSIATVDESGVALAAIQGLNQKLNAKDAEIEALKQSVAELKQMVRTLAEKN